MAGLVLSAYRQLLHVESRFRTLKDFLHLRPIRHWTEDRVKGHLAVCAHTAVVETLINKTLAAAGVTDPDIDGQVHTTELLDAGFNPAAISARQGHTVHTMLNHYSSRRTTTDQAAANHLGTQIFATETPEP